MIVRVKSKLIKKFDQAISDAKKNNCVVMRFTLESHEENKLFMQWQRLCGGPVVDEGGFDYEGIPVIEHKESRYLEFRVSEKGKPLSDFGFSATTDFADVDIVDVVRAALHGSASGDGG